MTIRGFTNSSLVPPLPSFPERDGAESSRPASLLSTLRTHQSPGEWQDSLPACSLALTGRDLHPLDFIRWFPLLHFWFLHFHAYPSATYRELPLYQSAFLCHSNRRSSRCTFPVGKHIGV